MMVLLLIVILVKEAVAYGNYFDSPYVELTTVVKPQTKECFYHYVKSKRILRVEFQVIDAGISAKDLVISFFVYSPTKRILMKAEKKTSKIKRISIMETGDFQICLDNSFSVMSSKTVYFELSIDIDPKRFHKEILDDFEGINDNTTLSKFRKTAKIVLKNLESIKHYQDTYRAVEARDTNLQEKNLMKVNSFSSLTVVFIMLFGSLHLFVLKSMFNRKSLIYKVLKILC